MSSMSHTSFSSSRGDSLDFDSDLTLNDRLKAFKSSNFDPEAYVSSKCQSMHEKVRESPFDISILDSYKSRGT